MHLCNTEPKKNVAKVKHITFVSPDAVFTGKNILLMLNIYVYIQIQIHPAAGVAYIEKEIQNFVSQDIELIFQSENRQRNYYKRQNVFFQRQASFSLSVMTIGWAADQGKPYLTTGSSQHLGPTVCLTQINYSVDPLFPSYIRQGGKML